MVDQTTDARQSKTPGARRLPAAVNFATTILVISCSLTLIFVVPVLITDLGGDRTVGAGEVLLVAVQVAVTLAMLVLSILVRRGRRWAWLALVGLLVLGAVTDGLSASNPSIALGSLAVSLAFLALLAGPRSCREYFKPTR